MSTSISAVASNPGSIHNTDSLPGSAKALGQNDFLKLLVAFRATDGGGNFIFVDDVDISVSFVGVKNVVPTSENISVYPNPAKDEATLSFSLTDNSDVQVQVVDVTGRVMNTVANEKLDAGTHTFTLNTASYAAGVYNVMIHTEGGTTTERLTVVK